MNFSVPMSTRWILALALCLTPAVAGAAGEKDDPRVAPAGAKVEGKTLAEWSAAWWQWALAIKKDRNPILDTTGEFAGEGQAGPVWFLAGNTGGKTARKCEAPSGKPLFFPIVNLFDSTAAEKVDEKTMRGELKTDLDRATDLEVTLDGKAVAGLDRFRTASAIFTFTGPAKAEDALFATAVGKQKAITVGYWVMLNPLPTGKHTLGFKGKLAAVKGSEAFEVDVAYELTVVDKPKK